MPLMPTSIISSNSIAPTGLVTIYDSTLQADAANFDVQNIPGGYKHLFMMLYLRGTNASNEVEMRLTFNNDSGANYHWQRFAVGDNTTNQGEGLNNAFAQIGNAPGSSATANYFGMATVYISNYSGGGFKPLRSTSIDAWAATTATMFIQEWGAHWRSTNTINQITITPSSGNWLAGSRLTIYGMGGTSQSLSQSYVGYNTIGGSSESLVSQKVLAKTFTVTTDYLLTSIQAYVKSDGVHVYGLNAALWADNAGAVGELLAASFGYPMNINATPRWFSVPISYLLTAGTYWIGVKTADVSGYGVIYYDSGADMGWTEGGGWISSGANVSPADTTHKYSIRANVVR